MKKPLRVLYVDDEEPLRVLVKNQLIVEGYSVDTTDDGDTALEKLKTGQFDVMILDIRMPRMNGIEVLKKVKGLGHQPRIIMLTGVDEISIAIEAVKNGANDYLTKPFDITHLLACIERITEV